MKNTSDVGNTTGMTNQQERPRWNISKKKQKKEMNLKGKLRSGCEEQAQACRQCKTRSRETRKHG